MKPYLIRALYDWILDSRCTPYVMINAEFPEVIVPTQFVQDGKIVLNLAPHAIQDLLIDEMGMSFVASFGGLRQKLFAPIAAILAVYAMENGQGMMFEAEASMPIGGMSLDSPAASTKNQSQPQSKKKPHLHIVEDDE